MATYFLSRRWRPNIWPFWALIGVELALTIALLVFVGVAAPNEYRNKLWADGAANGFNSSPSARLYAAANYRPYKTPMVWSQFLTNYNLVIVVLSMFIMLCKATMFIVHVFPPIISVVVHTLLIILYAIATAFQASSDLSDPKRPQPGPAWYITKSCSVAHKRSNVGYCMQAKATFACTVTILGVFVIYLGLALFSCIPSHQHREEVAEKRRLRKEKYAALDDDLGGKTPIWSTHEVPASPAALNPVTPRTFAFNKLSGTKNVPLKINTGKTSTQDPAQTQATTHTVRSPAFPRALPVPADAPGGQHQHQHHQQQPSNANAPMYFPPPPKVSGKK